MTGWLGLVVVTLAAYRITRVVTTDSIGGGFRDVLFSFAWDEDHPEVILDEGGRQVEVPSVRAPWRTWLYTLFNCSWCLGVWVSYGVLAFWCWVVRDGIAVAAYLVTGAAVAGAQGFIASRRDA